MEVSTLLINTIPLLDEYGSQMLEFDIKLEEDQETHLPSILHNLWSCERDPVVWRKNFIKNNLGEFSKDGQWLYYLIQKDGIEDIIGVVEIYSELKTKSIGIKQLYIKPEYRKEGIATTVLNQLKATSKKAGYTLMTISVLTNNLTAKKVYNKVGFRLYSESLFMKL